MDVNQINPDEFVYSQETKVEISAELFQRLREVLNYALTKETQNLYADNYKYVDKNSGAEIKKITEKNKDNAVKIVDVDKVLSPKEALVYRTREGVEVLRLKLMTEEVHMSNIQSGLSKHKSYYENLALGDTKEGTEE